MNSYGSFEVGFDDGAEPDQRLIKGTLHQPDMAPRSKALWTLTFVLERFDTGGQVIEPRRPADPVAIFTDRLAATLRFGAGVAGVFHTFVKSRFANRGQFLVPSSFALPIQFVLTLNERLFILFKSGMRLESNGA